MLVINRPVLTLRVLRQPCVASYAPGDDRVVLLFEESSRVLEEGQMWRLGKDVCFCFVPHGILSWVCCPDSLACTESKVDAADPCKIQMQDWHWKQSAAALCSVLSLRRVRIRCVGVSRPGIWG
jgi:hypothetical protein